MALTKCTGFSEVLARNSRASPRPKWLSPSCPVLQILCQKQRALRSSKNPWSLLHHLLRRSPPPIAIQQGRTNAALLPVINRLTLVATDVERDAPLANDSHAVKSAVWRVTMRTCASNGMTAMVIPLKRNSPKPSMHHVPFPEMRLPLGF